MGQRLRTACVSNTVFLLNKMRSVWGWISGGRKCSEVGPTWLESKMKCLFDNFLNTSQLYSVLCFNPVVPRLPNADGNTTFYLMSSALFIMWDTDWRSILVLSVKIQLMQFPKFQTVHQQNETFNICYLRTHTSASGPWNSPVAPHTHASWMSRLCKPGSDGDDPDDPGWTREHCSHRFVWHEDDEVSGLEVRRRSTKATEEKRERKQMKARGRWHGGWWCGFWGSWDWFKVACCLSCCCCSSLRSISADGRRRVTARGKGGGKKEKWDRKTSQLTLGCGTVKLAKVLKPGVESSGAFSTPRNQNDTFP